MGFVFSSFLSCDRDYKQVTKFSTVTSVLQEMLAVVPLAKGTTPSRIPVVTIIFRNESVNRQVVVVLICLTKTSMYAVVANYLTKNHMNAAERKRSRVSTKFVATIGKADKACGRLATI